MQEQVWLRLALGVGGVIVLLTISGFLPLLFWVPVALSQAPLFLIGTWLPVGAVPLAWYATRRAPAWIRTLCVTAMLVVTLPLAMLVVFKSLGPQHNPGVGVAAIPSFFVWLSTVAVSIWMGLAELISHWRRKRQQAA